MRRGHWKPTLRGNNGLEQDWWFTGLSVPQVVLINSKMWTMFLIIRLLKGRYFPNSSKTNSLFDVGRGHYSSITGTNFVFSLRKSKRCGNGEEHYMDHPPSLLCPECSLTSFQWNVENAREQIGFGGPRQSWCPFKWSKALSLIPRPGRCSSLHTSSPS